MKIFYAVQATGNGHVSRAMELLPYLQQYGKVDVFLSGANCHLPTSLPVKYTSKGLSLFYSNNGGLKYAKMAQQFNPAALWKEVKALPIERYDMVVNDFESITAMACALKGIPSVAFGHQAAFQSAKTPRPHNTSLMGEWLLKYYGKANAHIGFHFKKYDDFIFEPVIKKAILQAKPICADHITVYLSAYDDAFLLKYFRQLKHCRFEVFSKKVKDITIAENVTFIPLHPQRFNESMIQASSVITGAGFETPAEVLQLGKKLMVIPIRGQYEQLCNAAALEEFGVTVVPQINHSFVSTLQTWLESNGQQRVDFGNVAPAAVEHLVSNYPFNGVSLDLMYAHLIYN